MSLAATQIWLSVALPEAWSGKTVDADAAAFFESKVRPLLVEKCQRCHGEKKSQAGLRLLSREAILTGGDSGPAAMPGNPADSLLIRAVEYVSEPQMPPDGKLSDAEIEVLKRWIQQRLPWPDSPSEPVVSTADGPRWTDEQRGWWSLRPLAPVEPPAGGNGPAANPIDRFLQVRLDSAGINPLPPADKRTLIRRASFDLTGLPPSPEKVEAFVKDPSPDAFARVVERLLDSPHYGERWGRHWLDLVRYADYFEPKPGSHGSAAKFEIFEAWRYRDWVVQAFNRDLPYDQFIVHQIAGDKLTDCRAAVSAASMQAGRPHHNAAPYNDGLIATTVLAIGAWDNGDADKDKVVSDIVDDQINVIGQTFLGLTLACARCHDHKFDPISTEDYYALAGIFYSSHVLAHVGTKGDHTVLERTPLVPAEYLAKRQEQLNRLAEVTAELAKLQPAGKSETSADAAPAAPAFAENEIASAWLTGQRQEIERQLLPDPPKALAIHDGGTPGSLFTGIQDVPIHIRGSYGRVGPVVNRGLPRILAGEEEFVPTGSGRLELARWIACADNPLTARVMVNRVWQWHFGEGLVRTASNFGRLGERPTHPELLDWLAREFIRSGWSIKSLHRLMMNSAAYQRASSAAGEVASPAPPIAADPENRLLARWTPRRLEAECIRDAMLADSGRLDNTLGGPACEDLLAPRRSLYIATTRWGRAYYSSLFDSADPEQPIAKRNVTTVAPQALFFLNHPFVESQAQKIADTVVAQTTDEASRLERLYARLFGRRPTNDEISIAHELLARRGAAGEQAAWTDLVQVLLASNEFCYVD
ncbi:MAG TPA: PSD1 and planctomycete cytochrome C domain-containing protein [Pirellulales bacterium]|nr:PSD1 and planctomycete cytochrome C domain-containing protein [Pirellulales bacterium]